MDESTMNESTMNAIMGKEQGWREGYAEGFKDGYAEGLKQGAGGRPLVAPQDTCTGCGVRPGQTHWDNCPHHPPFSQPVYHGGGR